MFKYLSLSLSLSRSFIIKGVHYHLSLSLSLSLSLALSLSLLIIKNRRTRNNCKTDAALINDYNVSVGVLFVPYNWLKKKEQDILKKKK